MVEGWELRINVLRNPNSVGYKSNDLGMDVVGVTNSGTSVSTRRNFSTWPNLLSMYKNNSKF